MRWIFAVALFVLSAANAVAQGTGASFPTPGGQYVDGMAILVPCGSIVNGQPVVCPPGQANGLQVNCTNCSPSAPIGAPSNPVNGTIGATNAFQLMIAQNASRRGCSFQNQGTHNMYVSLASTPTLANSWIWFPGEKMYCAGASNVVVTDTLQVTGTAGDAFAGAWQ